MKPRPLDPNRLALASISAACIAPITFVALLTAWGYFQFLSRDRAVWESFHPELSFLAHLGLFFVLPLATVAIVAIAFPILWLFRRYARPITLQAALLVGSGLGLFTAIAFYFCFAAYSRASEVEKGTKLSISTEDVTMLCICGLILGFTSTIPFWLILLRNLSPAPLRHTAGPRPAA
jgi:hypothetical protein